MGWSDKEAIDHCFMTLKWEVLFPLAFKGSEYLREETKAVIFRIPGSSLELAIPPAKQSAKESAAKAVSCYVPFTSCGGQRFPEKDVNDCILKADIEVREEYPRIDGKNINSALLVQDRAPSLVPSARPRLVHIGSKEAFKILIKWLIDEDSSSALELKAAAEEIDADPLCKDIPGTQREALIFARIGQGRYREGLMKIWGSRCAVTGCAISDVLTASHAKPWKNSTNKERLDPYNGFLLAASIDRLFDRGLISFMDGGELLVGNALTDDDLKSIGLTKGNRLKRVDPRNIPYLEYHRQKHGFV